MNASYNNNKPDYGALAWKYHPMWFPLWYAADNNVINVRHQKSVTDYIVGWGDNMLFGAPYLVHEAMGTNDVVNFSSDAHRNGEYTAFVHNIALAVTGTQAYLAARQTAVVAAVNEGKTAAEVGRIESPALQTNPNVTNVLTGGH